MSCLNVIVQVYFKTTYQRPPLKGVCDSDLIKALEALKMLQIDTG
jgi:hypothetical protein